MDDMRQTDSSNTMGGGTSVPVREGTAASFDTPPTSPKKSGGKMLLIIGILALVIILGLLYYLGIPQKLGLFGGSEQVAAVVNGEEILAKRFEARVAEVESFYTSQGAAITDDTTRSALRTQVLDDMINEEIVAQAAVDGGIAVSNEEVSSAYEEIKLRFASPEEFDAELDKNGFTEDSFREQVERELYVQKYIDQFAAAQNVTVSGEEVEVFYQNAVAAAGTTTEAIPTLEEVASEIEAQLRDQKLQELLAAHVAELRANAEIETRV